MSGARGVSDDDVVGLRDRARGALVGLAVGDALGTTLEFSARNRAPHHKEMTGGGPFGLAPGVWTDDTSMALALADSLIACDAFEAADLMTRFTDWWQRGAYSPTGACFDIGVTTRQALARFQATGDPFAGDVSESSAGNGSIMRLAPAVLYTLRDAAECSRIAAIQGRTTHGAPQAIEGCVLLAGKLRRAILGETKDAVLAAEVWNGHAAIRSVAAGDWRGRSRDTISSSGYVVHTLEAAFWCVDRSASFEEAVTRAVNLADDADTMGAVTGQLAGALYGAQAIPERWLRPLAWRDRIIESADRLVSLRAPARVER